METVLNHDAYDISIMDALTFKPAGRNKCFQASCGGIIFIEQSDAAPKGLNILEGLFRLEA